MPPKRAAAAAAKRRFQEEDDEDLEDLSADDEPEPEAEDSEEEERPKKKRATPKKPAAPRAKKATGAFMDDKGWSFEPPSLIYKDYGSVPTAKIAAFDLDGTLVNVKSTAQFPKDADDWKWFNKKAADVVRGYHEQGYKIVLFTNQGAIKSAVTGKMASKVKDRVDNIMRELGVPAQVFAACQDDDYRKPSTGMWDFFCSRGNGGVLPDLSSSFFVGDAAGRPADFADSDRGFAEAVGLTFKTPEEEFGEMDGKKALPPGSRKAAAPVEQGGGGGGANPELVDVFNRIADKAFAGTGANDKFKGMSAKKVAGALATFPVKVTLDNLKDVGKLQGVGKGSIAKIKEFLETGRVAELEDDGGDFAGGQEAPALRNPGQEMANKFM